MSKEDTSNYLERVEKIKTTIDKNNGFLEFYRGEIVELSRENEKLQAHLKDLLELSKVKGFTDIPKSYFGEQRYFKNRYPEHTEDEGWYKKDDVISFINFYYEKSSKRHVVQGKVITCGTTDVYVQVLGTDDYTFVEIDDVLCIRNQKKQK